jgi:hypothetical protein
LHEDQNATCDETAVTINLQLSKLCVNARKKARTGRSSPDVKAAADRISRIAFSGLVGDGVRERSRANIMHGLIDKKNAALTPYLRRIEGETARRTMLRRVLGAMSLFVFGEGVADASAGDEGADAGDAGNEAAETVMFHSESYTIPVEIEGRGSAVVEYKLHRFTDTPGTDYREVTDVIDVSGFGHFASSSTSARVLQSLVVRPGNPGSFGETVCAAMAQSMNAAIEKGRAPDGSETVRMYSAIFSADSMGCLLLGRMAKSLDPDVLRNATFHFRNPLLLSPTLDIPKGVSTYVAYAETKDNVVAASGVRRAKSKMRRACLDRSGGTNVQLLPLRGAPCSEGRPRLMEIVLGRNHSCILELLVLNIKAESAETSGRSKRRGTRPRRRIRNQRRK